MGSDQLLLDLQLLLSPTIMNINQLLDLRPQLSLYLINLNLLRGGTFSTHQVRQSLLLLLLLQRVVEKDRLIVLNKWFIKVNTTFEINVIVQSWSCSQCTFDNINPLFLIFCELCNSSRSMIIDLT